MRPYLELALASVRLGQEAAVGFLSVQSEAAKPRNDMAVIGDDKANSLDESTSSLRGA
jgi:hypothetical protein